MVIVESVQAGLPRDEHSIKKHFLAHRSLAVIEHSLPLIQIYIGAPVFYIGKITMKGSMGERIQALHAGCVGFNFPPQVVPFTGTFRLIPDMLIPAIKPALGLKVTA